MRAVLWVRVSSEPQSHGYTPAEYERRAVAAARNLGLDVARIFSVTESAKTSEERKYFREMVEFAKANKIDFIIAEDIDRITRNYKDTYVIQELIDAHGLNVHFVATGRTINRDSPPQDHFVFAIMAGWAQLDNRQRGIKTRTGMEGKVKQGGLPCLAPVGYLNVADPSDPTGKRRTVAVDPARASLVRKAFELYNTGEYSIASLLAEMTRRGLRTKGTSRKPNSPLSKHALEKTLKNPFYVGEFQWSGKVWKGSHEPIVSRTLFESVQQKLRRKFDSGKGMTKHFAAFRGLFQCGYCGAILTPEVHKGATYYRCTYNKPYNGKCPQGYFREKDLAQMIEDQIGDLYVDKTLIGLVRRELAKDQLDRNALEQKELKRLETRRAKVQGIFQAALELKAEGKITAKELDSELQHYRDEKAGLELAIENLKTVNVQCAKEAVNLLKLMSGFKKTYCAQPLAVKAEILKVMVKGGRVRNGELFINWAEPFNYLFDMNELFQKSGVWGERIYNFINTIWHADLGTCLGQLTELTRIYSGPGFCPAGA
jgi:DNA invertase Pin-like site-specific DNA recombinase